MHWLFLKENGCLGGVEVILAKSEGLTAEELEGFPFEVERDNLALALAVCELAGVNRTARVAGNDAVAAGSGKSDCKRSRSRGTAHPCG